jgi:hypothetical protein
MLDLAARPPGPFRVSWELDGQLNGLVRTFESLREAIRTAYDTAVAMGPTIPAGAHWTGCRVESLDSGELVALIGWEREPQQ